MLCEDLYIGGEAGIYTRRLGVTTAYLLTYLPTYLPVCLPTYIYLFMPTCLYLSVCVYMSMPTYLYYLNSIDRLNRL